MISSVDGWMVYAAGNRAENPAMLFEDDNVNALAPKKKAQHYMAAGPPPTMQQHESTGSGYPRKINPNGDLDYAIATYGFPANSL